MVSDRDVMMCVVWLPAACRSSSRGSGCFRPLLGVHLLPTVQWLA